MRYSAPPVAQFFIKVNLYFFSLLEERRKEEEKVHAMVELERKKSIKKQEEMNEENRRLREQIEQERRDHELALRLARESKGGRKIQTL